MLFMLTGVTATWFVLAYGVALLLEWSRWLFSMRYRIVLVASTTAIGIASHFLYLVDRVQIEWASKGAHTILANWYDWSLVAGLGVACIYLLLILRRPESPIGTFLLPLELGILAIAYQLRTQPQFDRRFSTSLIHWIHGISLLVGIMLVTLGMAMATMYLLQSWFLKRKLNRVGRLRLPSLEYLQTICRLTLFTSASAIAIGLLSGVIINLQKSGSVGWTEPGILFSGGLFLWLTAACLLQWRWSQRGLGRWTAWLNIGSFLLTILAFMLVVGNPHGRYPRETEASNADEVKP